MLSKNKIKALQQLQLKKLRDKEGVFIAEGTKIVGELMEHFTCTTLVATKEWLSHEQIIAKEIIPATAADIKKISAQKTPQEVVAVFEQVHPTYDSSKIQHHLSLALDGIQDPGNLGTIIRTANWFGIEHVFCSLDCADIFHPKTIQASMGAIAGVCLHRVNLPDFFADLPNKIPIYGAFLNGASIYNKAITPNGIIVLGNEGNGIRKELEQHIPLRISIPSFSTKGAESLNVAAAAAIICSEFKRR